MEDSVLHRVRMLLANKGVPQLKIAEATGIRQNTFSRQVNGESALSGAVISAILEYFPDASADWIFTGKGSMLINLDNLKGNEILSPELNPKLTTRPRIPYTAAAGSLTSAVEGVTSDQCEQIPRINAFPDYDFTIILKGDSMEPKYEGGDEVACKRIDSTSFIQWGKVHVLDTAQGIIIKRIYEDGEKIRCTSYNPEYPDFSIQKEEIFSMSLVVGLIRL